MALLLAKRPIAERFWLHSKSSRQWCKCVTQRMLLIYAVIVQDAKHTRFSMQAASDLQCRVDCSHHDNPEFATVSKKWQCIYLQKAKTEIGPPYTDLANEARYQYKHRLTDIYPTDYQKLLRLLSEDPSVYRPVNVSAQLLGVHQIGLDKIASNNHQYSLPVPPNLCWGWCGGTGGVCLSCREQVGIMSAHVWDNVAELQSACDKELRQHLQLHPCKAAINTAKHLGLTSGMH